MRTNPVWEENEKEKEDVIQVIRTICLKPFNEEGRYQPSSYSREKQNPPGRISEKSTARGIRLPPHMERI